MLVRVFRYYLTLLPTLVPCYPLYQLAITLHPILVPLSLFLVYVCRVFSVKHNSPFPSQLIKNPWWYNFCLEGTDVRMLSIDLEFLLLDVNFILTDIPSLTILVFFSCWVQCICFWCSLCIFLYIFCNNTQTYSPLRNWDHKIYPDILSGKCYIGMIFSK